MNNIFVLVCRRASPSLSLFTAVALLGCSSGDSGFSQSAGTERAPCRSGRTCDPGLICLSDVCVRMTDGGSGTGGVSSNAGGSSNGGAQTSSGGLTGNGGSVGNGGSSGNGGSIGNGGSSGNGGATSGGSSGAANGGSTTGGSSGNGGTPASGGASGGTDGGLQCNGSHPNVQGQRRFCNVGSCYCTDPFDTCFTSNVADSCCNNTPICGNDQPDGGVNCVGTHPVIGPPRTCSPGYCLCSNGSTVDTCYPTGISDACCPPSITPVCVSN